MIMKKNHQERYVKLLSEPEYAIKIANHECSMSIKTATKISHNKPDLLLWDTDQKRYQIIEFSCTCDINLIDKTCDKISIYDPLIQDLQVSYPQYRCEMISIINKALGICCKKSNNVLETTWI